MRRSGSIIGLIAGVLGVLVTFPRIMVGGPGNEQLPLFGGIICACLTILLAAVALNSPRRALGVLLCCVALVGALIGYSTLTLMMLLALVGGILITLDRSA